MTHTREMLETSPTGVPLGVDEVAAAIDACLDCVQSCLTCADADLHEEDIDELRRCVGLDHQCADVCDVTARVLSQPGAWDEFVVHRLLQGCVRVCTNCAEECHKHAAHHRHCAICEQVCRICIQACNALLDAEAFAELQNLAGG